ncbi:MAG: hypothetical protein LBC59_09645 [Chitinispirillales bacterium]|jgi:hypothetical protein|nr:hypothetical protein [Chitinispirillales bacterium]
MVTIDAGELIRWAKTEMKKAIAKMDAADATLDAAREMCTAMIEAATPMYIRMGDRLKAAGYLPTDRRGNLTYWEPRKTVHPNVCAK